mgnify:CR=1 FL=1
MTRVFDDEDVVRVSSTVHRGRADGEDDANQADVCVPGFCRAVKLAEIAEHGHVLTAGRYVGAEAAEDDDEACNEKMERLPTLGYLEELWKSCAPTRRQLADEPSSVWSCSKISSAPHACAAVNAICRC